MAQWSGWGGPLARQTPDQSLLADEASEPLGGMEVCGTAVREETHRAAEMLGLSCSHCSLL